MRSSNLRQFPDTLAPLGGVLLKRAPLSQAARAERLLDEARRRAQRLVRDAEREADACRAHAATAGYEAGFARAIAELAAGVERIDAQRATLLERVVDDVRRSLEHLLDDPDLLLRIVNALASRRACATDRPLRVSVPPHAKRIAPAIRERLNDAYPSAQVVVADTRTFVVESGEDILEFDPRAVARARLAMRRSPHAARPPRPPRPTPTARSRGARRSTRRIRSHTARRRSTMIGRAPPRHFNRTGAMR